jgi:hypothetical protein
MNTTTSQDSLLSTDTESPNELTRHNILGVDYTHLAIPEQGDLYLTDYGLPFMDLLRPENWYARDWFEEWREPLDGTSTIYRMPTRAVNGRHKDIVVKWCRVGEEVPVDTFTLAKFAQGEFNSPYEEFSLVMEMRNMGAPDRILTHKPLAIYVPLKKFQLWQTGRCKSRIARKKAKYRDVELDIYRHYILIYEWIKGESIVEACNAMKLDDPRMLDMLKSYTERAIKDLAQKGYRVLDMKPAHIIVRRQEDHSFIQNREGKTAYALVDFELLQRTPKHEQKVTALRRSNYLVRQRDRFGATPEENYPPHLSPAGILDVTYVYGHSESTHGSLWVVGRDPSLFDYFQPERWRRTQRIKLAESHEVYYTKSKDDIHLVWKVSRVGDLPEIGLHHPRRKDIMEYGYNSPFREFKLAFDMSLLGIHTIYPRAIYMTGLERENAEYAPDHRRFKALREILTPEGTPVLMHNHVYLTIWGYWNGLDELLASEDRQYCTGLNIDEALRKGLISTNEHEELLEKIRHRMALAGYEDLDLKGTHYLLTLSPQSELARDSDGLPAFRVCNFGLIRRMDPTRDNIV